MKRLIEVLMKGRGLPLSGNVFCALWLLMGHGVALAAEPVNVTTTEVGLTAGEFRVDESGAATYHLPLSLPGGRAGVSPQLGLAYSSNNTYEGPLGVGWSVSGLSAITRCPQTPVHDDNIRAVRYDDDDKFCLDGQRLLLKSGTYGAADSTYYTEVDNFSLITAHGQGGVSGPMYFTVQNKAGETHYYGDATGAAGVHGNAFAGTDAFVEPSAFDTGELARQWGIKAIVDAKGNYIRFHYHEDSSVGTFYIDRIEYAGFNDGNTNEAPFASVTFEYVNYNKGFMGFMAGSYVYHNRLLDRIDISTDNATYRSYHLGYETSERIEERTFLTSVTECADSSASHCLPATEFTWQRPAPLTTTMTTETDPELGISYETPVDSPFVAFGGGADDVATNIHNDATAQVMDIDGDGLSDIVFVKDGKWHIKRGHVGTSDVSGVISTTHSEGGDNAAYALNMDYNGDGVRDLLVANSDTENWHALVFNRTQPQNPLCQEGAACDSFLFSGQYNLINTGVTAMSYEGGTQIMDINGDGQEDIVYRDGNVIKGAIIHSQHSYTEVNLYTPPQDIERVMQGFLPTDITRTAALGAGSAVDINGDGRSDMVSEITLNEGYCSVNGVRRNNIPRGDCTLDFNTSAEWINDIRTDFYTFISAGTMDNPRLDRTQTLGSATQMETLRLTDLNGDGLTDLLYVNPINDTWYYRLSNGVNFEDARATSLTTTETRKLLTYFVDMNADGRGDMLHASSDTAWRILFSRPTSQSTALIFEDRGGKSFEQHAIIRFGDFNGDGKMDLMTGKEGNWDRHSFRPNIHDNVISDITNGFGVNTHIDYAPMTDANVYVMRASDNADSNIPRLTVSPVSGAQVVSQVTSDINTNTAGSTDTVSVSYEYGGLLFHKQGRGGLGFQMLRTTDNQSGVVSETRYSQDYSDAGFAKARMPVYTRQSRNNRLLSEATNVLATQTTANGAVFAYIDTTTEQQYVLNNTLTASDHVSTTVTDMDYDDWGNVTRTTITVTDNADATSPTLTTTTVNQYGTASQQDYARLGRLTDTTVTKTRSEQHSITRSGQPSTITRQTRFTYRSSDYLLHGSIVSPDELTTADGSGTTVAGATLTTEYGYDKYGNKTSVSVTGNAIPGDPDSEQTRTTTTTFDSRGRFVNSVEDALDQEVTFKYNGDSADDFGGGILTSATETSPNGLSKTTHYNHFGRVTSVVDVTGNTQSTSYHMGGANTVLGAHYYLTQTNPGTANTETYFDKWGREIASRVQGFDGNWITTRQSYDARGRVQYRYEPGSTSEYTHHTYDDIGRATQVTRPNGGTITMTVSGLETTTTNELNQTSVVLSSAFGETRQTTDHLGNTVAFEYDSFGNLITSTTTDGIEGNTSTISAYYDTWGRKYRTDDPIKGTWRYTYNAFGEIYTQKNANDQEFTLSYDLLGRKTRSYEPNEGTLCWGYGTNPTKNNVGKLVYTYKYPHNATCGSSGYDIKKTFTYDDKGRSEQVETSIEGEGTFTQSQTYDAFSRPASTTYPTGTESVVITNGYNATGYLNTVSRGDTTLKTITGMTDRLQVKAVSYGDHLSLSNTFYSDTGLLNTRSVSKDVTLVHQTHTRWDVIGNLTRRVTGFYATAGSSSVFTEDYDYDDLNRLDSRTITLGANGTVLPEDFRESQNFGYDGWGNFTSKHGMGTFTYNPLDVHRLESVLSADGLEALYDMAYDNNGNIISDGQRTFEYGSFDKPVRMSMDDGSAYSIMQYGAERELYRKEDCFYDDQDRQVITTTVYLGVYEKVTRSGGEGNLTEHKYHLGDVILTHRDNGTQDTHYVFSDHQGSATYITDEDGNVVSEAIYDPWGKRTQIYQSSLLANLTILPPTDRGYTGHKHIDGMGIIHMGGRIYDPVLGRFMQADPFVQYPNNPQNYNRYAYVMNNPMSYTDPSGYIIDKLFGGIAKGVLKAIAKIPILNMAAQAAACYFGGPLGCAAYSALSTYAVTGSLGAALTAGIVSAITPGGGSWGNIATSAIIGGLAAKAQGGKFGHGFWSAGLGAGLGGNIKTGNAYANVAIAAIVGGTVSKLTGGKFANGAQSWAFSAAMAQDWGGSDEVSFEWDGVYEEDSPEFIAREKAAMDLEIADINASIESGEDLYASNTDWMESLVPDTIFENVLSSDAYACRMTCIDRHYGESYHYAGFVANQGIPGFIGKQAFEHYEELLSGSGTRRLNGNHSQFKDGQRMIRTLKQARLGAGALAVAAAGAKGYQIGAWGYCTVQCWGNNGD